MMMMMIMVIIMTTMMMMMMRPFTGDLILSVCPSVWQKSGYTETSLPTMMMQKKMEILL